MSMNNEWSLTSPSRHLKSLTVWRRLTPDHHHELNKKYQAQIAEQYRKDRFNEIYYRQNMLVKILMTFGSCLDAVLGRSWPGLNMFTVFTIYLVKHTMTCLSNNGVTEQCHNDDAKPGGSFIEGTQGLYRGKSNLSKYQ